MNVIVERQSPEWGNPSFDAEEAARLFSTRFHPDADKAAALAARTRELHALWASCFSQPLYSCRRALKELAHQNWREVTDCDAVAHESRHSWVSDEVFGQAGWVLFTDDDDWFRPDVFVRLQAIGARGMSDCAIWKRVRFDGRFEITPLVPTASSGIYAYTNNYAVRADTFKAGTRVEGIMQHGYADAMVAQKDWLLLFDDEETLSITNKSPCSWNYLQKALQSERSQQALREIVERYAWSPIDSYGTLSWAEPLVQASQQLFQRVWHAHSV